MRGSLWLLLLALAITTPNSPRTAEAEADQTRDDPAASQQADDDLEEFVPSEEISADKAISFPVDI